MKNNGQKQLREEMSFLNVNQKEKEELELLASEIKIIADFKRSRQFKEKFLSALRPNDSRRNLLFSRVLIPRIFIPVALGIVFLISVAATVVFAEKSKPGDILYPFKSISTKVIDNMPSDLRKVNILLNNGGKDDDKRLDRKTTKNPEDEPESEKAQQEDYQKNVGETLRVAETSVPEEKVRRAEEEVKGSSADNPERKSPEGKTQSGETSEGQESKSGDKPAEEK